MQRWVLLAALAAVTVFPAAPQPGARPPQVGRTLGVRPKTGPLANRTLYANSHALLIGISRYQHLPRNRWLQFADRDARDLRDLLASSYAFPPENITVLLNEQ